METSLFTLPNGLRAVHSRTRSDVACCGLSVNAGSRDEDRTEHGIAHFTEHMLFKGSRKYSAHFINNRLENVGGELNAFTTKEETVLHATILKNDLEKALELIADMAFAPIFPQKETDKERPVIIDEINSYKDNPSELIFEDFEERLFPATTLGRPILGSDTSLQRINAPQLHAFAGQHYTPHNTVLSIVSKHRPQRIEQMINTYFGGQETRQSAHARQTPGQYQQFRETVTRNTFQAHCVIGTHAYSLHDPRRTGLALLNNYLGGPASNSLLNTLLREKHGLVYTIDTNFNTYTDSGMLTIYFGTDKENVEKCCRLIFNELEKLCATPLKEPLLRRIKKQLLGQLAIAADNSEAQMLSRAKSLTVFNKVETQKEIADKVEAVTAAQLQEIAADILQPARLSQLTYV